MFPLDPLEHLGDLCLVPHVDALGLAADRIGHRRPVGAVDDHDVACTVCGESLTHRLADTAGAAGHDTQSILHLHFVPLLVL